MTEANRCNWSCEGAKADFNTEDLCDEVVTDDTTGIEAEEILETAVEEDFRPIVSVFLGRWRGEENKHTILSHQRLRKCSLVQCCAHSLLPRQTGGRHRVQQKKLTGVRESLMTLILQRRFAMNRLALNVASKKSY